MTDDGPLEADFFHKAYSPEANAHGRLLIQGLYPRIDMVRNQVNGPYVAQIDDRSSLRLDDRYLGAWRGGTLHSQAMTFALDNLETIKTVIENGPARLPIVGLFPLLRAVQENSALIIFLIGPRSRDERLTNAYLIAHDDARLRFEFAQGVGDSNANVAWDESRAEILELMAMRPSLQTPDKSFFKRISYTKLIKKADQALKDDPAHSSNSEVTLLSWWRIESGLSHAKQWAMVSILERTATLVDVDNRSAHVTLASPPAAVAVALARAVETLECALRFYGQRSKAPWAQPEDASEPRTSSHKQLKEDTGN